MTYRVVEHVQGWGHDEDWMEHRQKLKSHSGQEASAPSKEEVNRNSNVSQQKQSPKSISVADKNLKQLTPHL